MANLFLKHKNMVTSTTHFPIQHYMHNNHQRKPIKHPFYHSTNLSNHKSRLQNFNQQRHYHSKSNVIYQSQTIKPSTSSQERCRVFINIEAKDKINKNSSNFLTVGSPISSSTLKFKKQVRSPNETAHNRYRAKSFVGKSQHFYQQTDVITKITPPIYNSRRVSLLSGNNYRSQHVSPNSLASSNQKSDLKSTRNSPNKLLKQKNLDFLKTLKHKITENDRSKSKQKSDQPIYSNENSNKTIPQQQVKKTSVDFPKMHQKSQFSKKKESIGPFIKQIQQQQQIKNSLRKIKIQDFQLLDKLGKGSLGEVFIARQKNLGWMCVIKKISKMKVKTDNLQELIIRQIKLQSYLNNGHCTTIYGYFDDEEYVYLILELLPDTSLQNVKKKRKLPQQEAVFIIHQIAEGLKYLHSEKVIHRDLKPENIFMYQDYVKIGDFGCSIYHNQDELRNSIVGSLEYFSPEQLFNQGYSDKIDSWCLGILSYELLFGKSPYYREVKEVMSGSGKQIFRQINFPQEPIIRTVAKDFIRSLLRLNPEERMNMKEALAHPFFGDIDRE